MTIIEALPLITVAIGIATFFLGRSTASKNQGVQEGQILSDLGYVKSSVDDVKHKMDKQDERFADINARVVAVEESAKQAHHRIDEIRQHCCGD